MDYGIGLERYRTILILVSEYHHRLFLSTTKPATKMLFYSLLTVVASAALSAGASLKPVTGFGSNPTSLQMYLYTPDKVAEKPAIIVAVSYAQTVSV